MRLGVVKETFPGERRVSIIPQVVPALVKMGFEVIVESGAGVGAYYSDEDYKNSGAVIGNRDEVLNSDIITYVRAPGADKNNLSDLDKIKSGSIIIGMTEPLANPEVAKVVASKVLFLFLLSSYRE
jgi:NAD(P) transhydrogenase subunit alpha